MFVETKPQTMKNYFLLKITKEENEILEIYEDQTTAKFCANLYLSNEALKGNKISYEIIELEPKTRTFSPNK